MKISMYMLAHYLGDQVSSSIIQFGQRNIRTARLFTDDSIIEDDCLYVGRTVDFFPTASSKEVMMMNRNDMISVTSTDIRATFNQVLSAFDFYNDIEQEMFAGIFKPNPEQCVLSACESLLGPTFILTTDYSTIACSQNYNDRYVNVFWDTIVQSGDLPLELLMLMRDSVAHNLAYGTPNYIRFIETNAAPYCYGLICTYYGANDQVLGHMICSNTREISEFEEDIARIIMNHLNLIQAGAVPPAYIIRYQNTDDVLLNNLISGKESTQSAFHLRENRVIPENSSFCVAFSQNKDAPVRDYIRKQIPLLYPNSICITKEEELIALFWYTDQPIRIHEAIRQISSQTESAWGISNSFSKLSDTSWYYKQARFANETKPAEISYFFVHAIDYLLNQSTGESRHFARHPLVLYLENSALEMKEDLLDTLREYLLCERSIKRASEKLYVHRNTVSYRIDLIRQYQMLDFDSAYDRQYALISLMLPT